MRALSHLLGTVRSDKFSRAVISAKEKPQKDFISTFDVDGILACVGFERSNFEFTATLDRVAASGVINNESAHHTCGIPHEPRPVGKAAAFTRGDVKIGLMQQCCNAQTYRGSSALSPPSTAPIKEEIVDPTRHAPAGESPRVPFSLAHLPVTTKVPRPSTTLRSICISIRRI